MGFIPSSAAITLTTILAFSTLVHLSHSNIPHSSTTKNGQLHKETGGAGKILCGSDSGDTGKSFMVDSKTGGGNCRKLETAQKNSKVTVLTIARKWTDSLNQFVRSAHRLKFTIKVLGLGHWKNYQEFEWDTKVKWLKTELGSQEYGEDDVILYANSHDTLLLAQPLEIFEKFTNSQAKIVMAPRRKICTPPKNPPPSQNVDAKEAEETKVEENDNSETTCTFLGYKSKIYTILDQLDKNKSYLHDAFYDDCPILTKMWEFMENKDSTVHVDCNQKIFHYASGVNVSQFISNKTNNDSDHDNDHDHNETRTTNETNLLGQANYSIAFGDGVNSLANYLTGWTVASRCISCNEDTISLENLPSFKMPFVTMAIFIDQPTPFLEEFFDKIQTLDYPKDRIQLFVYNKVFYHHELVSNYIFKFGSHYARVRSIQAAQNVSTWGARKLAMDFTMAAQEPSDFYFSVLSEAHLDNPTTLRRLIEQNRGVIAPLLVRWNKTWSNFWGGIRPDGYYARSDDYMKIVKFKRRGIWNVPFISSAYLVNRTILKDPEWRPIYKPTLTDNPQEIHFNPDASFCARNRDNGIFMFVNNREKFGHLIKWDTYELPNERLKHELYQIFENPLDWERRYVHPNWTQYLKPEAKLPQPCPDVFYFHLFTQKFCTEFIQQMNHYGGWFGGGHFDARISGGYNEYPTIDIMVQAIGWEQHWTEFLQRYVVPLQLKAYYGYEGVPDSNDFTAFIVRYKPDEQRDLKPHLDESTYTINVALNTAGKDYEGGGCRFIRYNCSVIDSPPGWMLMHPGPLTHLHEGLVTTKGIRYIFVTFIYPSH